jgi:WD40 repeat protein
MTINKCFKHLQLLFCSFCCAFLLILYFCPTALALPSKLSDVKQSIETPNIKKKINTIAFSPDGNTLAIGATDPQIVLLDVATGQERRTLPGHLSFPVTGIAFSPDGKTLVSVGKDSVIRKWDVETGKQLQVLQGHEHPNRTVAVSLNGKLMASAGEDTVVLLWDVANNKRRRALQGHKDFVNSVAFSPDGRTLASGSEDARIILWNTATGKERRTLLGHAAAVTVVSISRDGKTLASASRDSTVRLWDVATGHQRRVLRGHTKPIRTISFSPDGKVLSSAGDDNRIILWDVASGQPLQKMQGRPSPVRTASFSPDGNTLSTGGENNQITLFDVKTGQQRQKIEIPTRVMEKPTTLSPATPKWVAPSFSDPGPGGPILVITSSSSTNRFGNYYTEILRNEGLNVFSVSDISSVSSSTLANYDVVILTEMALTSAQVTTLSNWVTDGGHLIAMRPDKALGNLLGLTSAGNNQVLDNGYLLIDASKAPGNGIVDQTIQFHGQADLYTLNGASSLATLYTSPTNPTSNYPAVTIWSVGSNGGQAAAFTYDLAQSIVYTRQGNPAWAAQERDGCAPIRSDDMFYGGPVPNPTNCQSISSSELDWANLDKVAIPQADEQQHLLANVILTVNTSKKPLPRFWYFPRGKKAVVLMTGDDHGFGTTATVSRFDEFKASGPADCSPQKVENWECIRGTSYIFLNDTVTNSLTNSKAADYNSEGFEISLHLNTNCLDYSPTSLEQAYTSQLNDFKAKYPSLPAPSTERHHCVVWSDWATGAQVELSKGIRLDTSYYYWPPSWVTNRPGFFTGSGMPMRFANKDDGTIIDVYEANTQMTDESGQTYPFTIDSLLDRALGAEGYYGVFDINAHTDTGYSNSQQDATNVVNSAKARGVPVVSARQLLTWLDGRNSSSFGSIAWNTSNKTLSFTITKGTGANGLQAMLPNRSGNLILSSITRNGSPVSYTTATTGINNATYYAIKGIEYAFFPGDAGSYIATYISDTAAPTASSKTPDNAATNINVGTGVKITFGEAIDPATVNTNTFELRNAANAIVSATVTYDAATRTATLKPNASLAYNTTYSATVKGGTVNPQVKDWAGNAFAANLVWSFTTASPTCSQQPCSIWSNSTTPANPSVDDPNAVELGVKFRSEVDGFITGIRFYKGSSNTGMHIGTLWSSSGQQLARATFSNETASGWQQVTFDSAIAITANTDYIASYHTDTGNYAADNNFFATAGVDTPPLHALQEGVNNGNGVYAYSATPTFPTSTFRSTNYWVDVVFTTESAPSVLSLWSNTTTPSVLEDADDQPVELGVKFRSDINGVIQGIRFYKGSSNTGTHIGTLWSNTGQKLAQAAFSNETASGWQQVNFATPVAITANTVYVASYHTPVGHYSVNENYFANKGVDIPPLHALQDGVSGSNGVHVYSSTPAFPTASFASSNYWVDIVFAAT